MPSHPSHVGAKLDVSVDIERLDEVDNSASTPAEIMLTIELNGWTDGNLKRSLVTLLLQEIDPVRENWDAVSDNGTTLMYSLLTTESQLQAIANPLPRNSQEACLVRAEPGGLTITLAHYLLKRVITDAHVYGRPRKALCGQWLVPSQNPDSLEVCPKCDEIHRSFASS
ncbi:DUF3039 domain-containing protein [Paeniglutamicibacter sp. Y32M11]|uniref:DUF3039 domain-containing protein n=1 Tax=Paeniglutamicibacter sp. Y32M11 TaxID=2853258 RepID=UPI001C52D960|nr:DUF3039 domain-containing protein [Paeniglutamicibacter sp. Y32M11]QXQ09755.1 DUF3039 domain-containing protein [Paeniglutamicibacter sp. Y32M11]